MDVQRGLLRSTDQAIACPTSSINPLDCQDRLGSPGIASGVGNLRQGARGGLLERRHPTRLSHSRGSLSAAVRARRRAEVASTRAPTVPVEGLWRELAGVAPTLGIGGDPPALTAGSSGDARQVRRQDPAKSLGNRVQTCTLVESHVGINDLSDYACMLAVHVTNY